MNRAIDLMNERYRWHKRGTDEKLSWKETLEAMCAYYGTFCGRWHSNDFWKRTKEQLTEMSEEQCKEKVIQIENDADASLDCWRAYQ